MRNHAYWSAVFLFTVLVLLKFSPATGFTSLIRFGETWQNRRLGALQHTAIATVPGSNGYDGQFYAQIALDPLLRNSELQQALDSPGYRTRRILLPAIAAILGLKHPGWTLQAYALINVICWFALGWLLYRYIHADSWISFARWSGCMFSMGVLDSVRQSLVDLPALLLLVIAIAAEKHPRSNRSNLWLALGNLTKETNLLGSIALRADKFTSSAWQRTLASIALVALPLIVWSLYVQYRFSASTSSLGLGNFNWPIIDMLVQAKISFAALSQGNFDGRYSFGLLAISGFGIQFWVLWHHRNFQSPWWRLGAAYSVLLLFLSLWVWAGYWAVCRAVLPMTIAFNLLLPGNSRFWPLWMAGNLTMLHAIWRFL